MPRTSRFFGAGLLLAACMLVLPTSLVWGSGGACITRPVAVEDEETGTTLVVIPPDWREYYPFSERFEAPVPGQTATHLIDLKAIRFTTDALVTTDARGKRKFLAPDTSSFPPELVRQPFAEGTADIFIVQAADPAGQTALRAYLERNRIEILDFLPNFAYLVRLDTLAWSRLPEVTAVFWAGLYQPAFRIHPLLDYVIEADPEHDLKLLAHFDRSAFDSTSALLKSLVGVADASVLDVTASSNAWLVRFQAKARSARPIVLQRGCLWVERYVEPELHNNVARTSSAVPTGRGATAGPIMDVEDVWARGIRGEGQIAAASDTGLDTGNLATLHWDFGQQGSATNPLRVLKGYALGRATWDDPNPNGGHGTHTSGSIVGNGFRSGSNPSTNTFPTTCFAGTAPKAQFVFQSVMDASGGLGGLPADLTQLFQPPYNDGARVHSNSWGAAVAGQYTTDSQNVDKFVWNNKDMVITFSAGNSGVDGRRRNWLGNCSNTGKPIDGVIDDDSIGAPGTAKNCITVGASENYRPDFVYEYPENDCTPGTTDPRTQQAWGWFDSCGFGTEPIRSDLMANNASGMGAFSSRGPTDDSRIKPDVTAPGIAIISTRTSVNQQYEQWGICNVPVAQRPYYLTMGGTSMSNPLTAGAAVLVRQYYVDGWHPNHRAVTHDTPVSADGFNPSAALVKATLINGAWDMAPGQYGSSAPQPEIPPNWDRSAGRDLPNNAEGYGRLDLERSLFPGSGWGDDPGRVMRVHDVTSGLQTGQAATYTVNVLGSANPLVATLVWTDPYGAVTAAVELVNDLDLEVYSPTSTRYYPNRKDWTGGTPDSRNNVEQVYVTAPVPGSWTVTVRGTNVPGNGQAGTTTQPYALVISGIIDPCDPPGTPAITSIVDADACATSGIRVYFSGGSGASRHDLVRDGSVVVTGYLSGDLYVPGDGLSHSYVVRAVTGSCSTDSPSSSFADADATPGPPAAPTVTDRDICALSGVEVAWSPVAGATSYDLLVDGATVVSGVTSPHTYTPGDGNPHTYQVRARNASCLGDWSPAGSGSDRSDCICSTAPTFAGLASVTPLTGNVTCGLRLAWNPATSNCPNGPTVVYNVYRRTGSDPFALLAACVTGTTYDDTTATGSTTYDYLVRAEDSTAFGGGPCNNGNEDANTVVRSGSQAVSETATQVTSPLTASSSQATTDLAPAFTVVSPTSATVSYTASYSSSGGTVNLFGPDDDPYNSGFWTINGSNQAATHCGHSTNYARVNQDQYMTLTNPISTVGYTNITVVFDWRTFNMETGDMLRLDYFNGTAWVTNVWNSFDNAAWHCGHSVALPAAAAGIPNLQIRFFADGNAGANNERAGIDYVIIRGDVSSSGSWTDNVRVTLLDPASNQTVLKAYGQSDGSPYDVLAAYTGPGTYRVRLEENAGGTATLTNGTMHVEGTACVPSGAQPLQFFTARAAGDASQGTVRLEWLNPTTSYGLTRLCVSTSAYPTDPTTCARVVAGDCKPGDATCPSSAGSYATFTHTGLANTGATTYYYTAWVNSSPTGNGAWSSPKRVAATPFNAASPNPRKWAYATGASALAPPGVMPGTAGFGAVFAVSNDRVLHGVEPSSTGGSWVRTAPFAWVPMAMSAPAQHQPPVVPLSSGMWVYLASQDGRVYCVNAHTGALQWPAGTVGPSEVLGTMLQAAPAAFFQEYVPSVKNLLFAGTRNASADNSLVALDSLSGARRLAYSYSEPGAIGIITGITVDYDTERVYFTSRARDGVNNHTVWCVDVSGSSAVKVWSRAVGDIDGGPVLAGGRLYVGTNAGTVVALELADNGATMRTYATGDGPVKGYVWPEWGTSNLYCSTTNRVWSLVDPGSGSQLVRRWDSGSSVPSPSVPMLLDSAGRVLVGGGDGRLYQLDAATGALAGAAVALGTSALGVPAFDVLNGILHVGSTSGVVHAVATPLPELAVETYAGVRTPAPLPEASAPEAAAGSICATLQVSSPQQRLVSGKGFSATKILDLTITAILTGQFTGSHTMEFDIYAPDGSLYRTVAVPFAGPRSTLQAATVAGPPGTPAGGDARPEGAAPPSPVVTATLPVAGTDIVANSLYGTWRVRARLDGAATPCSTGGDFVLTR